MNYHMTRLENLFQNKNHNILNVYCTAGYPQLESTLPIMKALVEAGANIIELGMPYSDPLADGETIQHSSSIALSNGMTISVLFEQLKTMRDRISIPVVLMGYLNPIMQYGFENFCANAAKVGVDGLIVPDIPAHEYEEKYKSILEKYNLNFIFLVTPETSEERVKKLDELSSGFLYAVSSSSTTGNEKDFAAVEQYLQRLQSYKLKNPVLVGFGIKDKQTFNAACCYANGAIIGSAFIKVLQNARNETDAAIAFVKSIIGN
jgi:tryptophan synthase alpha chain